MANERPDVAAGPTLYALLAAFGALGVAGLWNAVAPASGPAYRVLLLASALLLVGLIAWRELPRLLADPETTGFAAGLWLAVAFACAFACAGLPGDWDSLALLFGILAGGSALAAALTAVSPAWRRVIITGCVLWHFAAIFCAIVVVPPPASPPPFLASQAYVRLFHRYLIALNMNNGYHFYAPEPGPVSLAWFRVEWADGASAWVSLPDHARMNNHLERRRHGALASVLAATGPLPSPPDFPEMRQAFIDRRLATIDEAVDAGKAPIPTSEGDIVSQYREPTPTGRLLLASYARFVARHTPHPEGLPSPVAEVKAYMAEYVWPSVEQMQGPGGPIYPMNYAAYFMGAYTAKGELVTPVGWRADPILDKEGKLVPGQKPTLVVMQDPLIYWRLPIEQKPGQKLVNYVRVHAGDTDTETVP